MDLGQEVVRRKRIKLPSEIPGAHIGRPHTRQDLLLCIPDLGDALQNGSPRSVNSGNVRTACHPVADTAITPCHIHRPCPIRVELNRKKGTPMVDRRRSMLLSNSTRDCFRASESRNAHQPRPREHPVTNPRVRTPFRRHKERLTCICLILLRRVWR